MLEALMQSRLEARLDRAGGLAVQLPDGSRLGPGDARVCMVLHSAAPLLALATGRIGRLAEAYVQGELDLQGSLRDIAEVAARLTPGDPSDAADPPAALAWWRDLYRRGRSLVRHRSEREARQIQAHYDVSDAFYALWLDPRRVYSCAYHARPGMPLAAAQEAKLELICRKLRLQPGERLLDVGAGWGGLLLWAAEHHGVDATGITLSRNQHAHVQGLIAERGLQDRVRMQLLDYRDLPEDRPFDKIASVGMFEHVGRANLPRYFAKLRRLLRPGGLLLNHGITAGGTRNAELGAGIGGFIGRYIFPGGELLHVSHVLQLLAEQGLEGLDTENLRPHYAATLWAWSDALEAALPAARALVGERTVRAYRLYLAGSAMAFERGWMALHQTLAARLDGEPDNGPLRGAQSAYPFNREYMYR